MLLCESILQLNPRALLPEISSWMPSTSFDDVLKRSRLAIPREYAQSAHLRMVHELVATLRATFTFVDATKDLLQRRCLEYVLFLDSIKRCKSRMDGLGIRLPKLDHFMERIQIVRSDPMDYICPEIPTLRKDLGFWDDAIAHLKAIMRESFEHIFRKEGITVTKSWSVSVSQSSPKVLSMTAQRVLISSSLLCRSIGEWYGSCQPRLSDTDRQLVDELCAADVAYRTKRSLEKFPGSVWNINMENIPSQQKDISTLFAETPEGFSRSHSILLMTTDAACWYTGRKGHYLTHALPSS
ncbi:hypothetical protein Hypma_010960 [Hypsizygus marmoreus]|uniref:Uncharacterized protein n=1 Tax=Hypsizygus marmoreus TaxID=39966 RepID=A0A369JQ34_HYPMA|nr:hypothetical protein Hypma_010960 [Hypsizygus marmoreus]